MKTMTVKVTAACTSRCEILPVISLQEDNALKRDEEKGMYGQAGENTRTHHSAVYDTASQFTASKDAV